MDCNTCEHTLFWEVFSPDDFKKLNCNKTVKEYHKGEIIQRQGSYISQLCSLRTGIVKFVLEDFKHKEKILEIVDEPAYLAFYTLEHIDTYPFSIVALTSCAVCHVRRESLLDIVKNNMLANNQLHFELSKSYTYLLERFKVMSNCNSHGKLANALLYIQQKKEADKIFSFLTRKELSQLAGISIESLHRILGEMHADKIISLDNNTISISKPELMEKLSRVG
jgi:CRP/FNR family transcriptional regulator, polysaccharide utilization system transcription regulator